ncbi:MAG: HEPN domain-containing protein [Desulfamplus sp.]|nr:HEPN domain-containing protein [Desulfamplus sp.]
MVNIEKHIAHWKDGAIEDWDVSKQLINSGKTRHGLFFTHLALEKILKAHVCNNTKDIAPRLHNLVRLAELSGLELDQNSIDLLAEMNPYNIEGRYPEMLGPPPTIDEAKNCLKKSEDIFQWLTEQLKK